MNLIEKAEITQVPNILSLFNRSIQESFIDDTSETEEVNEEVVETKVGSNRLLVSESMFPDQSLYILEDQLRSLRSNLNRIKFYMEDINDLIPH